MSMQIKQLSVNSKVSNAILGVSLLAFVAFVGYVLFINQEVFYTAHDRSEFIYGTPFFHTLMSKPFGLMQYVGAWLTQLFYYPALGAGVLFAIWTLIFLVGVKAFRLPWKASALMLLPVACLLTSVVDLGYWIYILPIRGYWFSQSVGYLIMLLLLWAARQTPRNWHIVWYVVGFCLYPVLGWFALLFMLCLLFADKSTWRDWIGLGLLIFAAPIWHFLLYSNMKMEAVTMAGFPRFITALDDNDRLSIPFCLLCAVSVLIPSCVRFLNKSFVPLLCVSASIAFTCMFMFQDKTYLDEMRMVRYAEEDNWKEILNEAEANTESTTTMVMLKNVALMHEGGLLDKSFKIGNISTPINNPDSLHITLLEIASPIVCYNYGMMNEAIRLAYEDGIQDGLSPFFLKMLSRSAFAIGEDNLSDRFTKILRHNPFYADWKPAPADSKIKQLQKVYPDELTGIENSDKYIVNGISRWYVSDNKLASEQALFYSMIRCDSKRFWTALRKFVKTHENEEFPVHAQEAYIMYMDKAPEEKRMMIPVNDQIYDRYKKFWNTLEPIIKPGVSKEELQEKMLQFKDTYWYYNVFGVKVY